MTLYKSQKLGTIDSVVEDLDDIKQCYAIIFATQKGTVVHNPNLGWNIRKYMAMPLNQTKIREMGAELKKELNYQEPRATVTNTTFNTSELAKGKLEAKIDFSYEGQTESVII